MFVSVMTRWLDRFLGLLSLLTFIDKYLVPECVRDADIGYVRLVSAYIDMINNMLN